jgi:uncharacterized protein (DUF302 family)
MNDPLIDHAFHVRLDRPYEEALEQTRAALQAEGFGVITEVDIKATLKEKIGVQFRKYAILGACNPAFAHRALSTEPRIGLLLPCNVIVYEDEGEAGSIVSMVDPLEMLGGIEDPELRRVADDAHARLARAAESLAAQR